MGWSCLVEFYGYFNPSIRFLTWHRIMTIRLTNGKNGFFGTFSYANSQWIVSVNCRQIIMVEALLCLRWKISLICNCKQVVVLVEFHEFFPKLSWAYWQRVIIASHNQILRDWDNCFWRATCWVSFRGDIQSPFQQNYLIRTNCLRDK